jgi:nitroreductase
MDLLEGIATTRAIRRFRPDPIPEPDLATILFAASRAPTGSNSQTGRFLVLRDDAVAREAKGLLGGAARAAWEDKRAADGYEQGSGADPGSPKARTSAAMQHFVDHFHEIPVVLLPCLVRYRKPHPCEGANIYPACQNALLAARALGYGGVITMWHAAVEDELRSLLEIPDGVVVAAAIPLGVPIGNHGPVRRRPLGELVYDGAWGRPAPWAVEPPGTRHTQAGPPGTPRP